MWRHPSHTRRPGPTSRRRLLCPSSEPTSSTRPNGPATNDSGAMSNRRREPAAASPEATRRAMSVPRRSSTGSTRNQGTPGIASRPATRPTVPPAIAPLARSAATRAGAVPSHAGASHGGSAAPAGDGAAAAAIANATAASTGGVSRLQCILPIATWTSSGGPGRRPNGREEAGSQCRARHSTATYLDLGRGRPRDRSGTLGGSWPTQGPTAAAMDREAGAIPAQSRYGERLRRESGRRSLAVVSFERKGLATVNPTG